MKNIKIAYCLNETFQFRHVNSKRQVAQMYGMKYANYFKISNYKEPASFETIKKYGFEDKYIEPVLWYTKEKRVVRFKDATTEIEKQIIKIYEENNESKR
jgi:hypothetical protein